MSEETPVPVEGASEFLLYRTEGGETRVQVRLFDGSVWLTQRLIAELYQKSIKTINGHIKNIYEEGELEPPGNYPEIPDSSTGGGSPGRAVGGLL